MASIEKTIALAAETLEKGGLSRVSIKTDDFEVTLEKIISAAPLTAIPAAVQTAIPAEPAHTPVLPGNIVKAPIIGTFYESSAPGKPPFVKAGDKVKRGDVLFIIESMKLMNEVTSEFDGEVAEIMVQNGNAIEYDQPVMRIV